jgi:hypothetical protein
LIRDNREEVSEFLAEIIEDIAMERAIAEGETTELVNRDSIFQLLELPLIPSGSNHEST